MAYERLNPVDYLAVEVRGFDERYFPARVVWVTRVTPVVVCAAGGVARVVPVRLRHPAAERRRAHRLRLSLERVGYTHVQLHEADTHTHTHTHRQGA